MPNESAGLCTAPRAAVVGSGFGGLAAAVRLQAAGFRTTLFEARDQLGGRAYVYRDSGFTFDGGPTVITAPACLEEVFAAADRKLADYVELIPVEPFYRLIWDDGAAFDYTNDDALLEKQIAARNPVDVEGYRRFRAYSQNVFEKGYEELAAVPFLRFWDMVRVAPDLIRLRADRSVYSAVAKFIADERLREAFSFHSLLVGGNPFETSAIYTLIHYLERKWGVFFPRGGTGALVAAFGKVFEEVGGDVRLSTPVQGIRVERLADGRARHLLTTEAQRDEPFDLVVSNADVHHTYRTLFKTEAHAQKTADRLERMTWTMSLFVLYFGADRRYPEAAHHTVLFGPRYRGLLDDIFHGTKLPEDFSLYLHAPTVTDPSLAPPGCEAFYVLAPVPHLGRAKLDWNAEATAYAERILAHLERWLPDLRKHIVVKRWITPFTFRDELASYHGSAFGVAPLLTQSAWFRPHNRDAKIPGLYFVGAGVHPGAGVPGVVNSAKATVGLAVQDFARELGPARSSGAK